VTGLDTNILVRFFAKDDPLQLPKARAALSALTTADPGWVGVATILELVWVLTSSLGQGRDAVAQILAELLARETIMVERAETLPSPPDAGAPLLSTGSPPAMRGWN
jgi:predicted nucleic-acid-binding protein